MFLDGKSLKAKKKNYKVDQVFVEPGGFSQILAGLREFWQVFAKWRVSADSSLFWNRRVYSKDLRIVSYSKKFYRILIDINGPKTVL